MEKRKIRLARGAKIGPNSEPIYGWCEVEAYCEGGLATHKATEGEKWKWTVTHERSGLFLPPLCAKTRRRALANMLSALALGFDWSKGEAETIAAIRQSRGIIDALREIGRDA